MVTPVAEQLSLLAAGDPDPPDQASRDVIRTATAETLFVEAGAGAGKTTALVGRILTLVDEGVDIGAIAAITFTEKAAAELRHRLRLELGAAASAPRRAALDGLDHAPIGTLHTFARRILFEFPVEAGLPPGFTVLDDLESQLALDERWEDLLDELLDDADHEVVPGLTAAELVQLVQWGTFGGSRGLRQRHRGLPGELGPRRAPGQRRPAGPAGAATGRPRADRDVVATPVPPDDTQAEVLGRVAALAVVAADAEDIGPTLAALDEIRERLAKAGPRSATRTSWRHHGGREALDALRARARSRWPPSSRPTSPSGGATARRVVGVVCGRFVLDGATARAAAGTLEFHDLLVLARRLLATDEGARRRLHDRYQRLLLDEFQDTDPIQLEIAVRLTAPPDGQPRPRHRPRCGRSPGRLFVVGDPKQSIYRFRRADIATYLAAPAPARRDDRHAVGQLPLDRRRDRLGQRRVRRGDPARGPASSRPYGPLDACRLPPRDHGTVRVLGADEHDGDDVDADELRRREAASVAGAVATALREGWPVGDGVGGLRPVPARRHRRAAAGAHVAADAGGRARRAGHPVPGRERHGRLPRARRSATCCWRCAPRPTRPTRWRSSRRCARRCTAAATSSCWRGAGRAAAST